MDTSALSPTAMVVVVVVVMVARVAFNTYRMCTGNTRLGRREGTEVTGRGDSCDSPTELFSLSFSLYPFLSFSSLVFLAASSSLLSALFFYHQHTLVGLSLRNCVPFYKRRPAVIRRISHVGVTRDA